MKNLLFLLVGLMSVPLFAQKVDLDGEPVTGQYEHSLTLQLRTENGKVAAKKGECSEKCGTPKFYH